LSVGAIVHYADIVQAVSKGITVDKNLNLYDLQSLTLQLSHLGQKGVDFRVVPALPKEIDAVAYVVALEPDASHLFTRIRDGKPLLGLGKEEPNTPLSEAQVTVRVFDANSGGKAQKAADYLAKSGFIVEPVQPAP